MVVNHVVQVGNLALRVRDDGELEVGAADLVNVLDPLVVRVDVVGALFGLVRMLFKKKKKRQLLTRPMSLTPMALNSGSSLAKAPSSVVQMGVKSSCPSC